MVYIYIYIYIVDNAITRIMNIITSMMQILSCEDYQMTISEPVNKRAMCKWVWPDDNGGGPFVLGSRVLLPEVSSGNGSIQYSNMI